MIAVRQQERPYTAADLAEIPDDGRRFEVVGGELVVSPSPSLRHQRASFSLTHKIEDHVARTNCCLAFAAPFDVALSEHDLLQPDLCVVLRENAGRLTRSGIDGPPDLIIEIISPASARMDRIRKSATYATFGVPEYWIVDPDAQTIVAQVLVEGQYQPIESDDGQIRSRAVAGLVIDPVEIFALPDWLPELPE